MVAMAKSKATCLLELKVVSCLLTITISNHYPVNMLASAVEIWHKCRDVSSEIWMRHLS